jgi:hypothetical protein
MPMFRRRDKQAKATVAKKGAQPAEQPKRRNRRGKRRSQPAISAVSVDITNKPTDNATTKGAASRSPQAPKQASKQPAAGAGKGFSPPDLSASVNFAGHIAEVKFLLEPFSVVKDEQHAYYDIERADPAQWRDFVTPVFHDVDWGSPEMTATIDAGGFDLDCATAQYSAGLTAKGCDGTFPGFTPANGDTVKNAAAAKALTAKLASLSKGVFSGLSGKLAAAGGKLGKLGGRQTTELSATERAELEEIDSALGEAGLLGAGKAEAKRAVQIESRIEITEAQAALWEAYTSGAPDADCRAKFKQIQAACGDKQRHCGMVSKRVHQRVYAGHPSWPAIISIPDSAKLPNPRMHAHHDLAPLMKLAETVTDPDELLERSVAVLCGQAHWLLPFFERKLRRIEAALNQAPADTADSVAELFGWNPELGQLHGGSGLQPEDSDAMTTVIKKRWGTGAVTGADIAALFQLPVETLPAEAQALFSEDTVLGAFDKLEAGKGKGCPVRLLMGPPKQMGRAMQKVAEKKGELAQLAPEGGVTEQAKLAKLTSAVHAEQREYSEIQQFPAASSVLDLLRCTILAVDPAAASMFYYLMRWEFSDRAADTQDKTVVRLKNGYRKEDGFHWDAVQFETAGRVGGVPKGYGTVAAGKGELTDALAEGYRNFLDGSDGDSFEAKKQSFEDSRKLQQFANSIAVKNPVPEDLPTNVLTAIMSMSMPDLWHITHGENGVLCKPANPDDFTGVPRVLINPDPAEGDAATEMITFTQAGRAGIRIAERWLAPLEHEYQRRKAMASALRKFQAKMLRKEKAAARASAGSASPRLQPSSPASTSPAPSPMAADGMPVFSSSALKTKFKAVGVIAAAVAAAPDAAVADDDNGSVSSVSSLGSNDEASAPKDGADSATTAVTAVQSAASKGMARAKKGALKAGFKMKTAGLKAGMKKGMLGKATN